MLTKATLAAAGLRPGELAKIAGVSPNTASRYLSDKGEAIRAPGAVLAVVYAWRHLPEAVKAELLAGKHLGT